MRIATLLLFCLTLASCKSADELYIEGQQLEEAGRYEAAMEFYADALRKEPTLRKAQGRLLEAGKEAFRNRVAELEGAEQTEFWVEAGDVHLEIDRLQAIAATGGVSIPVPPTFAARRRDNLDAAITTLLEEGGLRVNNGGFERGLAAFEQARLYDPAPDDQATIDEAVFGAYATWAEADLNAGRFQAAFAHAGQAVAIVEPGSHAANLLADLQREAVLRGGLRMAPGPLVRDNRLIPPALVEATNEALALEQWPAAPPFVRVLNPRIVRQALRDLQLTRRTLTERQAARVGEMLSVETVMTGRVNGFSRTTEGTERETRDVGTRDGGRANVVRVAETVRLAATVAFDVIDVETRQTLCSHQLERRIELPIERGEYSGSIRTLTLDDDERGLFDTEELADREREAMFDLGAALAQGAADRAFECLLAQVP